MATNKIGKDLKIYADSSVWAFANSFEYSIDRRIIKTNTIESGEWDTYMQYGKGWTGSCDALICRTADSSRGFNYLKNHISTSNASLGISFIDDESTTVSSSAFITNLKVNNSGQESLLTYSCSFTGTSAI